MTPDQILLYFDTSPAIRLLRAAHAPYVVSFLHDRFKRARAIAIPHSELIPALASYQEQLEEAGCEALRDKPEEYLRDWSSSEKRWLHRFLEAGRNEPLYQLTPHTENVIEFIERVLQQDLTFVGTESRLRQGREHVELCAAITQPARTTRRIHAIKKEGRCCHGQTWHFNS